MTLLPLMTTIPRPVTRFPISAQVRLHRPMTLPLQRHRSTTPLNPPRTSASTIQSPCPMTRMGKTRSTPRLPRRTAPGPREAMCFPSGPESLRQLRRSKNPEARNLRRFPTNGRSARVVAWLSSKACCPLLCFIFVSQCFSEFPGQFDLSVCRVAYVHISLMKLSFKQNSMEECDEELHQVSRKTGQNFFWHNFVKFTPTDSTKDKFMWRALIFHFTWFASTPYRVKCRCSKLLCNAVIISIRLLTFASSIRQRAPRNITVSWY